MLNVSVDKIIPLTDARDHLSQLVSEIKGKEFYVLTKGGKPEAALVSVEWLKKLTGGFKTDKPAEITKEEKPVVTEKLDDQFEDSSTSSSDKVYHDDLEVKDEDNNQGVNIPIAAQKTDDPLADLEEPQARGPQQF